MCPNTCLTTMCQSACPSEWYLLFQWPNRSALLIGARCFDDLATAHDALTKQRRHTIYFVLGICLKTYAGFNVTVSVCIHIRSTMLVPCISIKTCLEYNSTLNVSKHIQSTMLILHSECMITYAVKYMFDMTMSYYGHGSFTYSLSKETWERGSGQIKIKQ